MYNKAKVQAFIRTLSDEEIKSQIGDLFEFMEEYKQLLIEEQAVRRHNNSMSYNEQPINRDIPSAIKSQSGYTQETYTETSLDFNVINAIQSKVARFTEDELLDNMKELDEILLSGPLAMPAHTFEEYRVAREACDVRYFEEYKCEPVMCRDCGSYLLPNQKFCGKCGSSLHYIEE